MPGKIGKVDDLLPARNCSQTVVKLFANDLGVDEATLLKIASGFGGGMGCAETCGAVSGSYIVFGLKYRHSSTNFDKKAHKTINK
jgi:C_GCAxxG_C_C family probable redox protein